MIAAAKLLFVGVVCCFLCAPALLADTLVTQTCTIAAQNISYNSTCDFNSFDTTLGVLQSVTMQLTGVSGTAEPLQSNFSSTDSITFFDSITMVAMTLTGADGTQAVATATSDPCDGSVSPLAFKIATCGATTFSGVTGSIVSASNLADYEQVGLIFIIPITARGYLAAASGNSDDPNSSGNLAFGGTGSIGGTLTLTYDFTPEPASPVLCGGSLLILAIFLRKRHLRARE